jgi:hypothetical protein
MIGESILLGWFFPPELHMPVILLDIALLICFWILFLSMRVQLPATRFGLACQ